jgi:PIN domain nuclease of toxin-antitoxin system
VRLLVDTHALLWYGINDPQLSGTARTLIQDATNEILLSPASYWEIAIKISIGKLALHQPYEDFIDACLNRYGFKVLPIAPSHTGRVATLPFPTKHKDPFDRLIVAQALVEAIAIVSGDQALDVYGVNRMW